MTSFWACAIIIRENGRTELLNTYDACHSIEDAQSVIRTWATDYGFCITRAWVDVYKDGSKVETIPVRFTRCSSSST